MPGLSLSLGGGLGVPAPALPPSYSNDSGGATISARAYGIADESLSGPSGTAGPGSVTVGVVATAALVWLWWTLPR